MAAAPVQKLGSLLLASDGTIDIGPLPASFGFKGPFPSMSDYFLSWSVHSTFGNSEFLRPRPEDNDNLRRLKQAVTSFPSRLKSVVEKGSPNALTSCRDGYPIVHRDFRPHNILFDDEFNIVGVIDWEFAHSAPFEVFAALTNMYSRFDAKTLHVVPDTEEGRQYIEDVKDKERDTGLSMAFGSILGDIGVCMTHFEEGSAVLFGELLDRYENERTHL
jgi:aminoglycoside phosphotransferase (APT) family kinase protein